MSDITTIVSSMGGFQAATPQDQDALESLLGSRGGRQRTGTPTPGPTLNALLLSATSFLTGTPTSGTIQGATAGSTIAATGLPSGLTIDGPGRTFFWSGSGSAGTATVQLTETLADSPNSPRQSSVGVTVTAATPTTATFSGAQVAPLATGTTDTQTAGQLKIGGDLRAVGFLGGVFVMEIQGTDASMKGLGTDPGVVEVSVDGGAYSAPPVVGGRYAILSGATDAKHLVVMRAQQSTGVSQGIFTTGSAATDVLTVTGLNPAVTPLGSWTQVDDGSALKSFGHVTMNNRQGTTRSPSKVRFVTDQSPEPFREQIIAQTVRGDFTTLAIVSSMRWVAVSTDGGAPVIYDLGTAWPAAKIITGLSGIHTYAVATSGQDRVTNMLAVGGIVGSGGREAPGRPRFDQYGDSITEGVAPSTSPAHGDVVRAAFALNRVPSNYGISGLTIPQCRDVIIQVLSRKTITSADMAVLASGRNNANGGSGGAGDTGLTSDEVTAYTDSCNRLLAAGYGLVLARGVTPGSFPNRNAQMKAAVEAIGNPKLKWIETSTWTGISTEAPGNNAVDGLHPSDRGYVKMTDDYALPAYRAAGAQA